MTLNAQNKIELNQATLNKLREITQPISVLSVIGPYRSGKSFLMNVLSEGKSKFATGSTTNACTKGVWIDILDSPVDSKLPCKVLIDTEGLFSLNRDETSDATLFLFTMLISSVLVYNSLGIIDERALEQFAFLTNIAHSFGNNVSNQSSAKSGTIPFEENLRSLFPHFVWLLRDFSLDLRIGEEAETLTSGEYLEYALMIRPPTQKANFPPETKQSLNGPQYRQSFGHKSEKNEPRTENQHKKNYEQAILRNSGLSNFGDQQQNLVRKTLKSFFPNRNCFTLVRPVNDERILQRIEQAKAEDIREEFISGVEVLSEYIQRVLSPKRVNNMFLTGESFVNLITWVTDAINNGMMPKVDNIIVV